MTRTQAVDFLLNRPVEFAKMLGFTKLKAIHNRWIIEMVRGRTDKTLQASRGTYKTTCASIALSIIIILLPNKRTLFMRKTDNDVKELIKQVQKILTDEHTRYFVNCIYGVNLALTVASATEISTNLTTDIKGTSQLVGIGMGSSLTGKHFDYIFTDDIVNIYDRISKAERERTKIVYQELQNVKNRDGKIFNTGTPWHEDDAFTIMPDPEKYDCYNPEIQEIMTTEELEQIKENMTPSLFAANYELRFVASEDLIFEQPKTGAENSMCEQGTMQVDSAFYGADYTAWSVMRKVGDKYYCYGKMRRKHIDDCYADILADYERFMCGKLYNEDNADKGLVAKEMRRLGMKVVTYHEDMNKHLKIVTHLKSIWKDCIFVDGTDKEFIQQICDYTEEAEHDDAPDSLASLARVMKPKTEYKPLFG